MSSLPLVFMFSGQGSQYYQMGQILFANNKHFKYHLEFADQLMLKITGRSIITEIYAPQNKKNKPFIDLSFTHPAIFSIEYALAQVLLNENIHPDVCLGASIGEFAALTISGLFDFETALQALLQEAAIIQARCEKAGMLAIMTKPELYQTEPYLYQNSELAAINFPEHFVISATQPALQNIMTQLKKESIAFQQLPVEYGFHSSLIESAKNEIIESAKLMKKQTPHLPVISCVNGTFLDIIHPEHFWEIIRSPILFQQTIQTIEKHRTVIYLDLGPSGTLGTFVKYILSANSSSKYFSILTPFGLDTNNLNKVLEFLYN